MQFCCEESRQSFLRGQMQFCCVESRQSFLRGQMQLCCVKLLPPWGAIRAPRSCALIVHFMLSLAGTGGEGRWGGGEGD